MKLTRAVLEYLQKTRVIQVYAYNIMLQSKSYVTILIDDFYIVCQAPISLKCGVFLH